MPVLRSNGITIQLSHSMAGSNKGFDCQILSIFANSLITLVYMHYDLDETQLNYPEIYYSSEPSSILHSYPPVIRYKPTEPIRPTPPQHVPEREFETSSWLNLLYSIPLATLVGFICLARSAKGAALVIGTIVFLCFILFPLCFIIYTVIASAKKSNDERRNQYLKSIEHYERMEKQYQEDLASLPMRIKQYEQAQKDTTYQRELTKQYRNSLFSHREKPLFKDSSSNNIKKGKAESILFKRLQEEYPNKCFDNSETIIETDSMYGFFSYYPDIAIVTGGLFIDIEVDEPYSIENGEVRPIHYLTDSSYDTESIDSERNRLLSKSGWEIIRFSEEQVVLFPDDCVRFVKAFIRSILDRNTEYHIDARGRLFFMDDLTDKDLDELYPWRRKKWTKQEAIKCADTKFRYSYLQTIKEDAVNPVAKKPILDHAVHTKALDLLNELNELSL